MRGAIPPLPQYAFMTWCLVKHSGYLEDRYHTKVYPKVSGLSHNEIYGLSLVLLVEKQHKGLWRQNLLDWLTK